MKLSRAAVTLLVFALLSIPIAASASGWKSKKSSPAAAVDTSDKVTALHITSITVTLFSTHASKEYKVTPATKVTVNGQPTAFTNLATGMDVTVTTTPDGVTAVAIDAKTAKR
jgi:hypothetical protein